MKLADTQDLHTDLSHALGEFWKGFTGVRPTNIRVVAGERAVAVWLDEVLSPAEQQLFSSQTGRKMLQELGERVMEQARPQLHHLVEHALEERAILVEVHLDVASRSVLGFFQLE
jgi:uncharacterized protein YbcI